MERTICGLVAFTFFFLVISHNREHSTCQGLIAALYRTTSVTTSRYQVRKPAPQFREDALNIKMLILLILDFQL